MFEMCLTCADEAREVSGRVRGIRHRVTLVCNQSTLSAFDVTCPTRYTHVLMWQNRHKQASTQPATVACKVEAQWEHVHVACTLRARFGADSLARSGRGSKVLESVLGRKFY